MVDCIKAGVMGLATIVIFAFAAFLPAPEASAEQAGVFTGTWVASGQRQPFEFVAGREVGTFSLAGNVSLKDKVGEINDFWAECIGLSDSVAGSCVRCVWQSLEGEKAFSVLSGQPFKKGVAVNGEFVGGTGSMKGLTGAFTFTWSSTFFDRTQGMFTGQTMDLSGSYNIP